MINAVMHSNQVSYHVKKKNPVTRAGNLSAKLFSAFANLQEEAIMIDH